MAQVEEKITGRPIPWFDGARGMIARAEPGGEAVLDWIEQQVHENCITLFEVRDEWQRIGIFTARWAIQYNGERHFLIIHGVSLVEGDDEFSFLLKAENLVKKIARDCNCSKVEIHSQRRGMDRRLERHGYKFQESIFSIEV